MKTDHETNYLEATTMRLMREAGLCGYGEDGGQYTVPAAAMISRIQRIVESAMQMGRSECIAEAQRLVWALDNGGKPYRRPATAEDVVLALRNLPKNRSRRDLEQQSAELREALELYYTQHRCGCCHPACNRCADDEVARKALASQPTPKPDREDV